MKEVRSNVGVLVRWDGKKNVKDEMFKDNL